MKKMIKYPSIEKFSTVVKNIQHMASYVGKDEDGNAIYDKTKIAPTFEVVASEKIHGTNAAVCYNEKDGFWVQSRENIITSEPKSDNASCAFFAERNLPEWLLIISQLSNEYFIDLSRNTVTIYFEWGGGNIQKNSALSGLEKRAMIFQHFKVTPHEESKTAYWLETKCANEKSYPYFWVDYPSSEIFNIMNFPHYKFEIDFENPKLSQNMMIELVKKIEENSPVGEVFGKKGNIGEGIVVTFMWNGNRFAFKVKGEKHSTTKVKTLKPVDEEKEKIKIEFVNNHACKAWRLEQMYQEVFDTLNGGTGDIKRTGDFIRSVIKDVMKEEGDVMIEMGIDPKEVNGSISKVARTWFMEKLESFE